MLVDGISSLNNFNDFSFVIGNHDNNNGAGDALRLSDKELYATTQRFNETKYEGRLKPNDSVYDSQSSDYFVDVDYCETRLIFFDSCYYSQGFSENTIEFVKNAIDNMPNGFKCVLITHMSTEKELNGGSALGNATTFKNMLAARKDKINLYVHGHSHCDYLSYVNEFPQVALCCSVPDQPPENPPAEAEVPTRTIGTYTELCATVMVYLPEENKAEFIRVGAGNDVSVPFREN